MQELNTLEMISVPLNPENVLRKFWCSARSRKANKIVQERHDAAPFSSLRQTEQISLYKNRKTSVRRYFLSSSCEFLTPELCEEIKDIT